MPLKKWYEHRLVKLAQMPLKKWYEHRLVKLAQQGNQAALEILYEKYVRRVFGFVLKKVSHVPTAEDITSEVFLKMLRRLDQFGLESKFSSWLFAIAKNTVADFWRKRYRVRELPLDEFMGITDVKDFDECEQADKQVTVQVKEILSKLPPKQALVLKLRFLQDYSIKDAAAELGESEANIKILQYRGLRKAAEIL